MAMLTAIRPARNSLGAAMAADVSVLNWSHCLVEPGDHVAEHLFLLGLVEDLVVQTFVVMLGDLGVHRSSLERP